MLIQKVIIKPLKMLFGIFRCFCKYNINKKL